MKKYSGSFQVVVPDNEGGTIVLTQEQNVDDRTFLSLKNIGQFLTWVTFGQADAKGTGYPLQPNEHITFRQADTCPNDRVTANAEGGESALAVIVIRKALQ